MDGKNLFKISMIYNSVCGCWHSGIACDLLDWLSFVIDLASIPSRSFSLSFNLCRCCCCGCCCFFPSLWLHDSSKHGQHHLLYISHIHISTMCMCNVQCASSIYKIVQNLCSHSVILRCIWWCDIASIELQRGLYKVWRCGYLNLIENASLLEIECSDFVLL